MAHGPAGPDGRCPWCHKKYEDALPRMGTGPLVPEMTTREAAYRYYYDPDWGMRIEDVYTYERPV